MPSPSAPPRPLTPCAPAPAAAPLVSVVIITRNRCESVCATLASLRRQSLARHEVVLVDNASEDATIAEVRRRHPEVRILRMSGNRGVAGARNVGIAAARADACVVIDDDAEFVDDDALERLKRHLDEHPADHVVACRILEAATGRLERVSIPHRGKRPIPEGAALAYFCGCAFAIRRSVFLAAGMFWEPLIYAGEELDFSYRLLSAGGTIRYLRSIAVLHKRSPNGRMPGQAIYFNTRNRLLIGLRNLPLSAAVSMAAAWWLWLAFEALRSRQIRAWLRGVTAGLAKAPAALRGRRVISRSALARVWLLGGRVLY